MTFLFNNEFTACRYLYTKFNVPYCGKFSLGNFRGLGQIRFFWRGKKIFPGKIFADWRKSAKFFPGKILADWGKPAKTLKISTPRGSFPLHGIYVCTNSTVHIQIQLAAIRFTESITTIAHFHAKKSDKAIRTITTIIIIKIIEKKQKINVSNSNLNIAMNTRKDRNILTRQY